MTNHLTIEGTYNIRDLGGLTVAGGGSTAPGILIRSGNLDQLPPESQQQLIEYGVRTVIDLRDEWEMESFPNVFANSTEVSYQNLPLIGGELSNNPDWKKKTEQYDTLDELYFRYIDGCRSQIGRIISTIAESAPTVVFHCYAGKDRTGIIAALTLSSVGVSDELIVEDYAVTTSQIAHLVEQWRTYAIEHNRDMQRLECDAGSEPVTMLRTLEYVRRQYGSVPEYLHECGVTEEQLKQLRSRLVQTE